MSDNETELPDTIEDHDDCDEWCDRVFPHDGPCAPMPEAAKIDQQQTRHDDSSEPTNRPWTAGPWSYEDGWLARNVVASDKREVATLFCAAPQDCDHEANGALVALAPEMAEAILACDPKWIEGWAPELRAVADKLRQING